jgi:putative ABC transport system permease protein
MYRFIANFFKRTLSLMGTVLVLALSLLPLSSLLLALPAVAPQETVLTESIPTKMGFFRRTGRRLFALFIGLVVLVGLLAVAVEGISRLPLPEKGSFGVIARALMPSLDMFLGQTEAEKKANLSKMPPDVRQFFTTPLHAKLPPVMVEHWPFVILAVYILDIGLLMLIGKVPLAYNWRNVRVRWKTNVLTAIAFAFVVALLSFLLAFVNGMNKLNENSGVPGNVFVLSDGSTDEIFSNLGYGDLDNVERVEAEQEQLFDAAGKPVLDDDEKELWQNISPLRIRKFGKKYQASRETYYSINQPVLNSVPPRRRFVQLRTFEDPIIASKVHNIDLIPGGEWFGEAGVDDSSRIQCVLGEGIAETLGKDFGKKSLEVGDVFDLGEMDWVVSGIMKSKGTTFSSEIWARRFSRIYQPFGKDKHTTLVMRTEKDTKEAARAYANYMTKRYTQQKLKAYAEPDYYSELTKTNNTFLTAIIIVCLVMAIGGVFGMMTTMFASIAQRIKDIGVLRLLGFKRWQVAVSFLLEGLAIAMIGGLIGISIAMLADGQSTTSNLSGGGGGPGGKSVALTITVDAQVMAMGLLFALAMGRLGGLVPALSAMRMKILDSLR